MLSKWVIQAKEHGRREGKPWLVVVAGHSDRRPIATLDFWELVELCQKAGLISTPLMVEPETDLEKFGTTAGEC